MSAFDAFVHTERYIGAVGIWIAGGEVARIQDGRGLLLSVQYGTVWITQAGSTKDVFVDAGGSFLLDRDGCTLISSGGSEPDAAITLTPSSGLAPAPAQRVAAWLRRFPNALATIARGVHARVRAIVPPAQPQPGRLDRRQFNRHRLNHAA